MTKYLTIPQVESVYEDAKSYQDTSQSALYSQFKNAYKLSVSNSYKGDAADAMKDYLTNGPINLITEAIDIAEGITMMAQLCAESFYQYENTSYGRVCDDSLVTASQKLSTLVDGFHSDLDQELAAALSEAKQYVSVGGFHTKGVDTAAKSTTSTLSTIASDLASTDASCKTSIDSLYERIENFKTFVSNVQSHCYKDKAFRYDNSGSLKDQSWYHVASNLSLSLLMEEDPFEYVAGNYSVSEDQWAAGLCSDVYAYAGYKFVTAEGEAGVDGYTAFAKGSAALFKANAYAQLTNYMSAAVEGDVLYAEGDVKVGFDDGYVGFHAKGEAGVLHLVAKAAIGTDDVNAYLKGEVDVATAEGKTALEFQDDGEFAVGLYGKATAVGVSGTAGLSFLSYSKSSTDSLTGEKTTENLFKLSVKPCAGVSAKAGGYVESETAIETEHININTLQIDLTAQLGLGGDISLTVPYPYFKDLW